MALTEAGSTILLQTLTGKTTSWGTAYIGLFTSVSGSTFVEPYSANGYARVLVGTSQGGAWNAMSTPSSGETHNTKEIHFPKTTGSWGTITHFGLFTASTGGTPYLYGALTSSVAVTAADMVAMFEVGEFQIEIA